MNKYVEVIVIVEGKTEQEFIRQLVAPYLLPKKVYLTPIQVSKPGSKGGDVKFSRVKNDLITHIKQRENTVITTFFDLYGLNEWPGKNLIFNELYHENRIQKLYEVTYAALSEIFSESVVTARIIPFFAIYEFEALLFSEPQLLAASLGCPAKDVENILCECGEPEQINNSPNTAPSKRLDQLNQRGKFKKTTQGIMVASEIGIERMREKCPQFNAWLKRLEVLSD